MRRRLTPGLALLRATGCGALLLLLWNPIATRHLSGEGGGGTPPLVLLDASLSMAGRGGRWHEALDSARALARGGVIWRFGDRVAAFDSFPPTDGASRLAPGLAAAAARGAPVAVVTDGELEDVAAIAPDLLRAPHVVVLPRAPFRDAFVAAVEGPDRVTATDTMRLRVSYGTAGMRDAGCGMRDAGCGMRATLAVVVEGRRIASRAVPLPDSGIVSTELTLPVSRIPHPGWSALEVRLEGAPDSEPRDDARLFVVELSSAPQVVVLAAPPDWDLRFLARTLGDVARVPLRMFVQPDKGAPWRDAVTLTPVAPLEVRRALAGARLVVLGGDPGTLGRPPAVLRWSSGAARAGDWYADPPPASPLSFALAGVTWDSLPPLAALAPTTPDSSTVVALTARLARRGPARPVLLLTERGGQRRVDIAGAGLYRWAFRGGASEQAYRALVAALAEWLLEGDGGKGKGERVVPVARVVANGRPIVWRWTGAGEPRDLAVTLTREGGKTGGVERRDTLEFDAQGRSELRLPPGVYRYAVRGGAGEGLIAVESYSDEWRPAAPTLVAHGGAAAGRLDAVAARDRWWLFVLAIAAFTAEWAWRRRQGLP